MAKNEVDNLVAGQWIAEWKNTGVPPEVVSDAFQTYAKWRAWETSKQQAKKGRTTQAKARAKKAATPQKKTPPQRGRLQRRSQSETFLPLFLGKIKTAGD